jgi:hypothetical protein
LKAETIGWRSRQPEVERRVRVNAPGNPGAKETEVRPEDVEPVKLEEPAGYGRVRTATHPPRVREMSEECIAAAQIQESALIRVRGCSSTTSVGIVSCSPVYPGFVTSTNEERYPIHLDITDPSRVA